MNRRDWLKTSALIAGTSTFNKSYAAQTGCATGLSNDVPSGIIRLGWNENPYGPSEKVMEALKEGLKSANRYADANLLRSAIAKHHGVSPDQIHIGAGSANILTNIALAYFKSPTENIVSAKPTFFILPEAVAMVGSQKIEVPLTSDKKHDLSKMASLSSENTKVIYICNPNNPTGTKLPHDDLKSFVEEMSKSKIMAVDEVYHDFIDDPSLIPLTETNKNIIIVRSFSKVYGLAGMRIGYAVAHPSTINHLQRFSSASALLLNQPVILAGEAALKDQDFVKMYLKKNEECKTLLSDYLTTEKIDFYPSFANLMYFSLDQFPKDFLAKMQAKKIIVREVDDYGKRFCRVSMSKPEEIQLFIDALKVIR